MTMPYNLFRSAALAAAMITAGLPAVAQIHNGSHEPPPADLAQRIAATRAAFPSVLASALSPEGVKAALTIIKEHNVEIPGGVTNFDNVSAPCEFAFTSPLIGVEQYASFFAPAPDGGAILNECSNFGINPHSGANFFAFNSGSYYETGVPKTPELIFVGYASKSSVSFYYSCGTNAGTPVEVIAYGNSGVLGSITIVPNDTWQQATVTADGIIAVGLVGNPSILLIDDLQSE